MLQRYSTRVPNNVGEDCSRLLLVIFGGPQIMLRVGPERAFVASYDPSLVAFPFKVTDTEYILTTCLTVNEITTMEQEMPPLVFNLHYGDSFTVPRLRHWYPTKLMADLYTRWERKAQLPPPPEALPPRLNWHWVAAHLTDLQKVRGHGPGSQLLFWDRVPGPCTFDLKPGEAEPQLDECEFYRQASPGPDWVKAFAARDQAIVPPTPGNDCKY